MKSLQSPMLRYMGTITRCLHSMMDMTFKMYQFQRGQFVFFTRICEQPGINLAALTYACKVDKGTTTKAVRKLTEAGYVIKKQDEEDRRAWRLYPTAKALPVYDQIIAEENRQIAMCLAGFTAAEKAKCLQMLQRMSLHIDAEWKSMK